MRCLTILDCRLQPQPQQQVQPQPQPEPEPEPEPKFSAEGPPDSSEDEEARSDVDWSPPDVQRGMIQPSLVLADQLTPTQILDMRMAFSFLDRDTDGVLTVRALPTVPYRNVPRSAHVYAYMGLAHQVSELQHLAPDATEAELQDMLGEVDADGSGSIEFPEFITMMVRKLKPGGDNEEDRSDSLRAFYDKNGAIAPAMFPLLRRATCVEPEFCRRARQFVFLSLEVECTARGANAGAGRNPVSSSWAEV